jgi:FlaA1/EpsC-like NDP-sugar epimerase
MLQKKCLPLFFVDAILIVAAYTLSFMLRFDFQLPVGMRVLFWQGLCVVLFIKPALFCCAGFYRNLWQYASIQDAVKIFKAVTLAAPIVMSVIVFSTLFASFPRSIIVLDWILLFFLVSISRLGLRVYREMTPAAESCKRRKTLIIGAGEAGSLLLKETRRQAGSSYDVIGFVDDDDRKQGMLLNGVPVFGKLESLQMLVGKHGVEEIVIAIPSAGGKAMRNIVEKCENTGVRFRTLPAIGDIMEGRISISQIKAVSIDALLGREPVVINEASICNYLTGKIVLVTGAAGSIGSEICRQVAGFQPGRLILLDNAETPLFFIERELTGRYPDLEILPVLGDIKNKEKIERVFAELMPQVVFHAAAYKHVPMMEYNPTEAVTNNIGGTKTVADAAHRFGVSDFVMISTDKAVNPTNVMGASKRAAEMYVQALCRESSTNFITVRFGNVLGSNGSVIPLFMEQIKKGGPVTVTDPDVVRYFMTIPEATRLVLQAGCLGKGGEIFILDMGEPVRIKDLAEQLIKLSGLVPYEDIDIVFCGLRPGEKLFEELLIEGEGIMPTMHDKIRVAAAVNADLDVVQSHIARLLKLADQADMVGIVHSLRRLVLEFTPSFRLSSQEYKQRMSHNRIPRKTQSATTAKILPLRANIADHQSVG